MCKSLLYVEDSKLQQQLFCTLYREKYDVTCANTAEEAIDLLSTNNFDAIVTDLTLGIGMDGDKFARWVKSKFPSIPITVLTANINYNPKDMRVIYKPTEKRTTVFE